jgi:hypothetical protein
MTETNPNVALSVISGLAAAWRFDPTPDAMKGLLRRIEELADAALPALAQSQEGKHP